MQMTDTMKPKSRLPITSARDYDNGQVNWNKFKFIAYGNTYDNLLHALMSHVHEDSKIFKFGKFSKHEKSKVYLFENVIAVGTWCYL